MTTSVPRQFGQAAEVHGVDEVQGAAAGGDGPAGLVAEHRPEDGEHPRPAVRAGRAAQRQDDPRRPELTAVRTASPMPADEDVNGASVPAGRVCRPQVFATSTTAVAPSKAIAAVCRSPVAAATSTSTERKPAATAAATLPSPPSASGSARVVTPRCSSPVPRWRATSAAVRLPLNLSGAMSTFMAISDGGAGAGGVPTGAASGLGSCPAVV